MQTFKTATGRMVSMHPEKAFVNYQLATQAMTSWTRGGHAGGRARAYGELMRETGTSLMQGVNYDLLDEGLGPDDDRVLLQGRGYPMAGGKMKLDAIKSVKQVRL